MGGASGKAPQGLDKWNSFRYHPPNEFPDKGAHKGRTNLSRTLAQPTSEVPLH
jgi:hypothetical protein